jgi:GrpB-like predicted nucleotidyltransferase (UPF0157 family)
MDPKSQSVPITEEKLRQITVGELKTHDAPVVLADYDLKWPVQFEHEARRIRKVLGERALRVEHIGSTSVPGLVAKPIIDILLVVADSADEPSYVPPLEEAGYVLRIREPDWYQHRLFKGPETNINLHVFSKGSTEIERVLLLRDWLRENEEDRRLYAETKRRLAGQTWRYVQNYADAKSSVIEAIILRARENLLRK